MLKNPEGASIQQLRDATGWKEPSVRGALVNLKNKDKLPVTSKIVDATRRYLIVEEQA